MSVFFSFPRPIGLAVCARVSHARSGSVVASTTPSSDTRVRERAFIVFPGSSTEREKSWKHDKGAPTHSGVTPRGPSDGFACFIVRMVEFSHVFQFFTSRRPSTQRRTSFQRETTFADLSRSRFSIYWYPTLSGSAMSAPE